MPKLLNIALNSKFRYTSIFIILTCMIGMLPTTSLIANATATTFIDFVITDTPPYHVHQPGTTFSVKVKPHIFTGDNLFPSQTISLLPGSTPFSQTNIENASAILSDGQTLASNGWCGYDFYKCPNQYVDIISTFSDDATIQSLILFGANPNQREYNIESCSITFIKSDNSQVTVTPDIQFMKNGRDWKVMFSTTTPYSAKTIKIRAAASSTLHKIAFTELKLFGKAPGQGNVTIPDPGLTFIKRDFKGNALSARYGLTLCQDNTCWSPPNAPQGYFGLEFSNSNTSCSFFDGYAPGEPKEYGFAVMPIKTTANRTLNTASHFGMVQADYNDPYIYGYNKTLQWKPASFDPDVWRADITTHRNAGLEDKILVSGSGWDSPLSDSQPLDSDSDFINTFRTTMQNHFAADPTVVHWELGREENLRSYYNTGYYWQNLDTKVQAAKDARTNAGAMNAKFIYQIALSKPNTKIDNFFNNSASEKFDILSLHPYDWNDNVTNFRDPEEGSQWMKTLIDYTRSKMIAANKIMPIQFTEMGAPHQNVFTPNTYKDGNIVINGISRKKGARLTSKYNVYAQQLGVEKVDWYNYIDAGPNGADAEQNFGMVDYWGFPKPMYLAYYNCGLNLEGKEPAGIFGTGSTVQFARFSGSTDDCLVVWAPVGSAPINVPWSDLKIDRSQITGVTDTIGTPLSYTGSTIPVDECPIYITINKYHNLALHKEIISDSTLDSDHASNLILDGDPNTLWAAADGNFNHWVQIDLGYNYVLAGSEIIFEKTSRVYKYKLETSQDNLTWTTVADTSSDVTAIKNKTAYFSVTARYVKVTVTGLEAGDSAAIREINVWSSQGLNITSALRDNTTGHVIPVLTQGSTVRVDINVDNTSPSTQQPILIGAALFNGSGQLKYFQTTGDGVLGAGDSIQFSPIFDIDFNPTGAYIKIFMWDSKDGMKPLTGINKSPASSGM